MYLLSGDVLHFRFKLVGNKGVNQAHVHPKHHQTGCGDDEDDAAVNGDRRSGRIKWLLGRLMHYVLGGTSTGV